jgi:hypothetical protein
MNEVAEEVTAECTVAEILNYGAAVGVRMSFFQLTVRSVREPLQQKRFYTVIPR